METLVNCDIIVDIESIDKVSGTRPLDAIKDYIIFDSIDTIIEVLTVKEPMLIKI